VRSGGARDLRATLLSAVVTLLAAAPLTFVFQTWTWLVGVLIITTAMTATALALRALRAPQLSGTIGMIAVFVLGLTLLFARDHAWFGIVPSPDTLARFSTLLREAGIAARETGIPVGDDPSLHFLAALGVGGVLLAIDIAVVVAGWTLVAGIPMVAVHAVVVGSDRVVAEVVSFVCAALAFLWLLAADNTDRVRRYGRRYVGEGIEPDARVPSPLAAAARRMAAAGVAVAVVVPIGVPSLGDGLVGRLDLNGSARSGSGAGRAGSGTVNLFSFLAGTLRQSSEYPMVDVTTTDPEPHYLRFGVADELTPDGFVSRTPGERRPLSELASAQPAPPTGVASQRYVAEIDVRTFAERLLPIYLQPAEVGGARGQWGWDSETTVVHSVRTAAAGARYRVTYARLDFSPTALSTAPELAPNDPLRQRFTKLPPVATVRNHAAELIRGKTTQYDKVRAIFDFFSPANNFRYDRFTRAGNSGNAMVDFITTGRVGYCEQYAAALAWLVRAVGVPARVAFGFTRGNQRNGNTFTLTNLNLHAWTEVYFQGFGWVPFDATPPAAVPGAVHPAWAPAATPPAGGRETPLPTTPVGTGPEPSAGQETPSAPSVPPGGPDAGAGTGAGAIWSWPVSLAAALLIVLLLLSLPRLHRGLLRRQRRPHATLAGLRRPRRAAHAAWEELLDLLADYRVPAETAGPTRSCRAIGERLVRDAGLAPAATAGVLTLSRAEERATYARFPVTDADLATALRQVRSGLRERASRRTRLVAAVAPPSVLARWKAVLTRSR
jgi:transglutaminase-like putative cysteine protease